MSEILIMLLGVASNLTIQNVMILMRCPDTKNPSIFCNLIYTIAPPLTMCYYVILYL